MRPDEQSEQRERAARRARLDAVFGSVLPDTTADERDEAGRHGRTDAEYLSDRPPHHG
ncbi:hypothetical protein [Sciscionella marina]|uniref:hypothetical protein n=1 Tax=Sciscionella marina TaxID=508770 RepID=UPI00036311BC|nr:hypothetical protein [Sciscionella marina]